MYEADRVGSARAKRVPLKAAIYRRYGPPEVVEICDVAKPVPADDEVLIRIHATTVSSADWRLRSLAMPRGFGWIARPVIGFRGPWRPVLGSELSGVVEAVGRSVTQYRAGDRVVAFAGAGLGCHAEYRCLPAHGPVAPMPPNLTFAEAVALCFGGCTMLDYFRRAALKSGDRVLVNGAAGCVGSAAVQLAAITGASVTAVCSRARVELVRSLGAAHVIDYGQQDFAAAVSSYDLVVDTVGNAPFRRVAKVLAPGGRLLLVLASLPDILRAPWQSWVSGCKVIAGPAEERPEYVQRMTALAAAGQFKPVIDRIYPFDQIVDAHHHVDRGHKRGSVVVTLTHADTG
jgi:NADPH:quinone reductase-like Zn-dependent oxidoreductase